jgi:glycosyltransferase involved in cell wall biosynthesis
MTDYNILLFLGKRGGGAQLTLELIQDLSQKGITPSIVISHDFEHGAKEDIAKDFYALPGIHRFRDIPRFFFRFVNVALSFSKSIDKNQSLKVCIVMIQPLDLLFLIILRLRHRRIALMTILHEIESRGQKKWPTPKVIRMYGKCSRKLVVLNKSYIESQTLRDFQKKLGYSPLQHRNLFLQKQELKIDFNYFLCIGRNDSYKDFELLIKSWRIAKLEGFKLLIAGIGVPNFDDENVIVIDRWISDQDFIHLIENCYATVFPYRSNSQSGVLSLSLSLNKPFVITPVPELIEQSLGFGCASTDFTPFSFAQALSRVLNMSEQLSASINEKQPVALHARVMDFFNCTDHSYDLNP